MKKTCFPIILACMLLFQFTGAAALAADNFNNGLETAGQEAGFDDPDAAHLSEGGKNVEESIGKVIQIILSLVGVLFLLLMIYGGFLWMNARGNEQEAARALETIRSAIIGLIITIGAYAITRFIL